MKNKQLQSWDGAFGDTAKEHTPCTPALLRKRVLAFPKIFQSIGLNDLRSIVEVGANIGMNLRALQPLTEAALYAREPNPSARKALMDDQALPALQIPNGSAEQLPFEDASMDIVFTCTVLIHIQQWTPIIGQKISDAK